MNQKKITRSMSDRVFAGICGGLGNYFDVDPVIFRILFCVFSFIGGAGVIVYLISIFVIPSEKNTLPPSSACEIQEEQIYEIKEEIKKEVKNSTNSFLIIVGILLIVFGCFFLVPGFLHRYLWPGLLIGFGIMLLFFSKKKS